MKSLSLQVSPNNVDSALNSLSAIKPNLVILFTSTGLIKDTSLTQKILSAFPAETHIIGCSTSGEIGDRVDVESVALMGLAFSDTPLQPISVELGDANDSLSVGEAVGTKLIKDDLKAIFILGPGKDINGSRLVEGIRQAVPKHVTVFGGLAGGGVTFDTTYTLLNGDITHNKVVAIGFYGDSIRAHSASEGGWKTFGPLRKVTKAVENILYELDGKPALDLYKEYLGDKAKDLPGSGLLYPFAILNSETKKPELIRTILAINEDDNSLIFAGNLDEGQLVSLMHSGEDELIEGAENAAQQIADKAVLTEDSAAICVSCIGRKLLMGNDTEEELDAVKGVLGKSKFLGFYSNGEISALTDGSGPELHNQTMTVTYLYEHTA